MSIDHLGQWPICLPDAADCGYCISGFVPVSDPICGQGYVRCANAAVHGTTTACLECGVIAFYPLQLRTDPYAWLDLINKKLRLIPHMCPTCDGVTAVERIPDQWGADT